MLKKAVPYMVAGAIMLSSVPNVYAAEQISDINGSYAQSAIQQLLNQGIIDGIGNGRFDPTGRIERQDFAIILAKALKLDLSSPPASPTFSDVPTIHYSYDAIEAAARAGLIQGTGNGTFGMNSNLTREQMAALFVRALGISTEGLGDDLPFSDADSISSWARDSVGAALQSGLITGNPNGTFDPQGNAERQAIALVATRFLQAAQQLSPPPIVPPVPNPEPAPVPSPNPTPSPIPVPSIPIQEQVATPTASLKSGEVEFNTRIELKSITSGVTIYFTMDGSTPSVTNGLIYSEPIVIQQSTSIKAIAVKSGYINSNMMVAEYTVVIPDTTAPVIAAGYPKAVTDVVYGNKAIDILVQANESGTAYYIVVPKNDPQPTAAQVKAGFDGTGQPALASGQAVITADTELIFQKVLIEDIMAYDYYVVVANHAGHVSEVRQAEVAQVIETPLMVTSVQFESIDPYSLILKVSFNKEVNQMSAEKADNYVAKVIYNSQPVQLNVESAVLQAQNNEVELRIRFIDILNFDPDIYVTIDNVEDMFGNAVVHSNELLVNK